MNGESVCKLVSFTAIFTVVMQYSSCVMTLKMAAKEPICNLDLMEYWNTVRNTFH